MPLNSAIKTMRYKRPAWVSEKTGHMPQLNAAYDLFCKDTHQQMRLEMIFDDTHYV